MKLSTVILSFALLGTVLAAIPFRHRRGLPGVSLKDPNPTTFTNFKQQYFYPRPSWGGYIGNYGNHGVSSYGVGTYGGYGANHGINQFGANNYGAGTYGAGSYSTGSSSSMGGAYGK
ncbi:keratin, type I cytoskeletal 10-like [Daphnia pulicaria]|uniref:keratin, type I cytoskeletal 10-like n=1 Tax=Daphnia pulicaria TaxID=35523 RepID=UPI001EEC1412|nr:keratin, type I cytoskeletal 10-like [Daphnia pulicaria]